MTRMGEIFDDLLLPRDPLNRPGDTPSDLRKRRNPAANG